MNLQQAIVCTKEILNNTQVSGLEPSIIQQAAKRLLEKVEADRKKILQIRGKALKDMRALAKLDQEARHGEADKVLCEALEALGFSKVVELFESYDKWYA